MSQHNKLPWNPGAGIFTFFLILTVLSPVLALCAEFEDDQCMSCHADAQKVKTVMSTEVLQKSVHADVSCTECHDTITTLEHEKQLPRVDCADCHEDEAADYKDSIHGLAKIKDERFSPGCTACHGKHDILPRKNRNSKINRLNISETCGNCHSQSAVMSLFGPRSQDPVILYERGLHGRTLRGDSEKKSPTCVDCHNSHSIYPPLNPKSSTSKFASPKTCGKCHKRISKEYQSSVHWNAAALGHFESPVCYDCHGEHDARKPSENVDVALASSQLCANCHANDVLMSRFGLDAGRFASYTKTYHGLASLRGSADAAKCTSCHEVHSIRGQSDPESTIHQSNLEKTCSRCHKDAGADFVKVSMHPLQLKDRNPVAHIIRLIYIWLIVIVVGGMILHNLIIISYYLLKKWQVHTTGQRVRRFQRFEVIQHLLMLLSFTILAITGFALKYPDAWWVNFLTFVGMDESARSIIHRGAGVLMLVVCVVQSIYFVFYKSGRREIKELMPAVADFRGFFQNMLYHLNLRQEAPRFGRYDYTEKLEYLALIWGCALMVITGLVLWFPEFMLQFLPIWGFEVAEIVHYYEAILAVLAIIFWHLFFTIFHPEKYPMSMTWLDGKVPEDEKHEQHALDKSEVEE